MKARIFLAAICAAALLPIGASAESTTDAPTNAPTNCAVASNSSGTCTAGAPCSNSGKIMTIYVPHNSPGCARSMEGCIATARKSLSGHCVPMTVDCVRLGQCRYATCASDSSNYGKYFSLGSVTYRSALDMQMYTVPNVTCFVHDTGGAFRGRPDKLDLATTVCPTCTDSQAGAIARNARVDITASGVPDTPYYAPPPYQTSRQTPIGNGYCITSTQPLIVAPCTNQQPAPQLAQIGQPSVGSIPQASPPSIQAYGTSLSSGVEVSYPVASTTSFYTMPVTDLLSTFLPKLSTTTKTDANISSILSSISSSSISTISNPGITGGVTVHATSTTVAQPMQVMNTFSPAISSNINEQQQTFALLQNIVSQMRSLVERIIALLRNR